MSTTTNPIVQRDKDMQPPLYAKRDIALARGEGVWLWDSDGASTVFLTGAGVAAVAWAMLALLTEEPRPSA